MGKPPPRQRGRPKDRTKRDAILDAARSLFLARGPHAVPLDAVAEAAGVSKSTFYVNFGDRAALLEAVIRRESERIVPEQAELAVDTATLPGALTAFGERLLRFLADPEMVGFERLIAASVASYPELPMRFYDAGPGRALAHLAALIREGVQCGALQVDDPIAAAEDLVGLWQGMMRVELSMACKPPPSEEALVARAARGVRSFFSIYST